MSVTELVQAAQFLVDASGNKKAVVLDYAIWEELLTLPEDWDDAEEIRLLREAGEEVISWEEARESPPAGCEEASWEEGLQFTSGGIPYSLRYR